MKKIAVALIKLYQKIFSYVPINVCRFYPSCSEYMAQSINKKGLVRGISQGVLRILRCHPFHPGGYDPVK